MEVGVASYMYKNGRESTVHLLADLFPHPPNHIKALQPLDNDYGHSMFIKGEWLTHSIHLLPHSILYPFSFYLLIHPFTVIFILHTHTSMSIDNPFPFICSRSSRVRSLLIDSGTQEHYEQFRNTMSGLVSVNVSCL